MAVMVVPRGTDKNVTLSVGSIVAIVEGAIILTMIIYLVVTKGCANCCGRSRRGRGLW